MDAPLSQFQAIMYQKTRQTWSTARVILQLAVCVRLDGPIETGVFRQAAIHLSARYPILCSRLHVNEGDLIQRQNGGTVSLEVIDIDDDEEKASKLLSAEADRPLDLFQSNPFRIILGLARPGTAFLMLVAHHIFVDEFALQRLLAEYLNYVFDPASIKGASAAIEKDHAFLTWRLQQEKMARDGTYARKSEYWLKYLAGADPAIHLPGRPADPPYQKLASIPFELDPSETERSFSRARQLGITHNALLVSTIFHTLRELTGQGDITLSLTSSARRPPFRQTIGQFAESSLVRQRGQGSKLDNRSEQLLFRDIVSGIKNYIPHSYFVDQLDWLKLRWDKKFTMADVHVNYLPREADLDDIAARAGYRVSSLELADRVSPARPSYYGVVLSFSLRPCGSMLRGAVVYESAIVDAQLAQGVTTALRGDLARAAH